MSQDKRPLRRHHDDNYVDRIEVNAPGIGMLATMVPRYKTSGLSGDHEGLSVEKVVDRSFHRMRDLETHAPGFIYAAARHMLVNGTARLRVSRKGHLLFSETHSTFGDAVMGLAWHIVTANEGRKGVDFRILTDAEERSHCQQVGCAEPPTVTYRYKLLQVSPQEDVMLPPKYDFVGQYTWYCARHAKRGDCGFEDADKNLEHVEGGQPEPRAGDESPSGFAGVVRFNPEGED